MVYEVCLHGYTRKQMVTKVCLVCLNGLCMDICTNKQMVYEVCLHGYTRINKWCYKVCLHGYTRINKWL